MRKPSPLKIPDVGDGKRGEGGHIGYLLRQAASAYRLRMERALADLAITPPQFAVLTMLRAYPGLSNADLARLALLTPQTVSVIVANLLRAQLLERRPHAVHGRIHHLDLTPRGSDVLAACRTRIADLEARLEVGLTPTTDGVIRAWLVKTAADETNES